MFISWIKINLFGKYEPSMKWMGPIRDELELDFFLIFNIAKTLDYNLEK